MRKQKVTHSLTRLCSESANLCHRQNFNQKLSGIPIRIAELIWIHMEIQMSAGSLPKCCGFIFLSASVISVYYLCVDFADDVYLLAELLELFVPILETMASEAASIGLEMNWQKTKVQALSCREDMPLTIKVQGQDVMVVEEFACLPWLSYPLINRKHL